MTERNHYYADVVERFRDKGPTVDLLQELANSAVAEGRLRDVRVSRQLHGMSVLDVCADARSGAILDDTNTYAVRSIASALAADNTTSIYRHPSVSHIIVASHYDGARWSNLKEMHPEAQGVPGCGGREGFEKVSETPAEDGLNGYLKRIGTSDPLELAFEKARAVAKQAPRTPVYAATIDHRTAQLKVFSVHVGHEDVLPNHTISMIEGGGDTRRYYDTATMPELNELMLPSYLADQLRSIQDSNKRQQELLHTLIPDFADYTDVQDPQMVWVSSYPTSVRNRVPVITDIPNNVFKLLPPVRKPDHNTRDLNARIVADQIAYPLSHSVEARRNGRGAFRHLNTVVIEGHSLAEAEYMARSLLELPSMQEWKSFDGNKIVIGHVVPKAGNLVGLQEI